MFDQLEERLSAHQDITYCRDGDSISVQTPSEDGYELSIVKEGDEWTVYFEGWHEHFADEAEAFECFVSGITHNYRVKVTERGGRPYVWTLQIKRGSNWERISTTGLFAVRFWRRKRTKFLYNGWRLDS